MNKESLNKIEETKKKMEELSDEELTKVTGGDNPPGMFMYEIGTKFCWDVQYKTDNCYVFEIKNRYVTGIQNMYDVDAYIIDRNGNMLDTPDSLSLEEYFFEFQCAHNGMIIIK